MDISKYLALKPQVDADVDLGRSEVKDAYTAYLLAKAVWDDAVNRTANLEAVKAMIDTALAAIKH